MIFITGNISSGSNYFATNFAGVFGEPKYLLDPNDTNFLSDLRACAKKVEMSLGDKICFYAPEDFDQFIPIFYCELKGWSLFIHFSDDEWRHCYFDRPVSLFGDMCSASYRGNLESFNSLGVDFRILPVFANPSVYYPESLSNRFEVSFVGSASVARVHAIRFLIARGIQVAVFGKGWGAFRSVRRYWHGEPSLSDINAIFSASKINLNFFWTGTNGKELQVKGRFAEIALSGGFQLVNRCPELFESYGLEEGVNIECFSDFEELVSKIFYYLENDSKRSDIASRLRSKLSSSAVIDPLDILDSIRKRRKHLESDLVSLKIYIQRSGEACLLDSPIDFGRFRLESTRRIEQADCVLVVSDGFVVRLNHFAMAVLLYLDDADVCVSAFGAGGGFVRLELVEKSILKRYYKLFPCEAVMYSAEFFNNRDRRACDELTVFEAPLDLRTTWCWRVIMIFLKFGYWPNWQEQFKKKVVTPALCFEGFLIGLVHFKLRVRFWKRLLLLLAPGMKNA